MGDGVKPQRAEKMAPQAPTVPLANVIDPTLDAGVELGEARLAGMVGGKASTEPAIGIAHLARLDPAMGRVDDKAEPGSVLRLPRAARRQARSRFSHAHRSV